VPILVDGGAECAALRRSLGATARFVLEELALRATADDAGTRTVQVSTRELADALALNKDTVTRALGRLREGAHITVVSRGGSTGAARWSVHAPGMTWLEGDRQLRSSDRSATGLSGRRSRRRRGQREYPGVRQLSLLE
jgi:hypothetical protein